MVDNRKELKPEEVDELIENADIGFLNPHSTCGHRAYLKNKDLGFYIEIEVLSTGEDSIIMVRNMFRSFLEY